MLPFVIQRFTPSSTKPPFARFALVRMPAGFEPKSGSVSPKQPIASPRAIRGSQLDFCVSDPKAKIGYITRLDWTLAKERSPLSPRSSSWEISPYATLLAPAQPYSSGSVGPKKPSSAMRGTSCIGNVPLRYASTMCGWNSSSTKRRAVSRTTRSSSVSSSSIA